MTEIPFCKMNMDTNVTCRLYKEEVDLLKEICKENNVSVSFLVRSLILDFLYPDTKKN